MAIERGLKLKVEILPEGGRMQDGLRTLKDSLKGSDEQVKKIGEEWDKIFRDAKQPTIKSPKQQGGGGQGGDPISEFAKGVGGPLSQFGAIYDKLRGGIEGLSKAIQTSGSGGSSGFSTASKPAGGSSGFSASKEMDLSKQGGGGKSPNMDFSAEGAEAGEAAGGEEAMAAAGPIGMIAGAALLGAAAIKGLADAAFNAAISATALSNPVTVERFTIAMKDAEAVVGQRFRPVIDFATEVVRGFGDFLANALPTAGDVNEVLAEMRPAMAEVKDAFLDVAPLLKEMGKKILTDFAAGLKIVASTTKEVSKMFRQLLGESSGARDRGNDSSMGAAAQPARIGGIDDIGRMILEGALSQGSGGQQDPQKEMSTTLTKILELMDKNFPQLKEVSDTIKLGVKFLTDGELGKDIGKAMKGIRDFLR